MRKARMTDEQRAAKAREIVGAALAAMRDDDPAEVNQLLAHAVHDGVQPVDLVVEIIDQSGGTR